MHFLSHQGLAERRHGYYFGVGKWGGDGFSAVFSPWTNGREMWILLSSFTFSRSSVNVALMRTQARHIVLQNFYFLTRDSIFEEYCKSLCKLKKNETTTFSFIILQQQSFMS